MDILTDMGAVTTPPDILVIRSRLVPWAVGSYGLLAVGAVLLTFAADEDCVRAVLVIATSGLLLLTVRGARIRLICDDDGLTTHQLVRSVSYPWSAVDRIGVADEIIIGARLAGGRWVPLLHYRGLGDTATTREALRVDRELAHHATTPLTLDGTRRRPPPPRWLAICGLVVFVAGVLAYSVISGNWIPLVFFGIQFGLQRKYGEQAGRDFRPVGTGAHRPDGPPTG